MKNKMSKKQLISVIIFNVAETILIYLVGRLICLPTILILTTMALFMVTRFFFGKSLHFKTWYRCLVWSLLILLTLFMIVKLNLYQSILFTIFSAFIMTGKANIKDMYLWGGNQVNKEVFDWVKFNHDNPKLKKYEEDLKKTDKKLYYIFIYRFREFKTYKQISDLMDIDEQRICEDIKIMSHFIEFSIRLG